MNCDVTWHQENELAARYEGDVITRKLQQTEKNGDHFTPRNRLSYPMAKTALLYDNFCKTGNDVIYDVIIWVQDGNCKKSLKRILVLVLCTI